MYPISDGAPNGVVPGACGEFGGLQAEITTCFRHSCPTGTAGWLLYRS
jgi:hypothetical protein